MTRSMRIPAALLGIATVLPFVGAAGRAAGPIANDPSEAPWVDNANEPRQAAAREKLAAVVPDVRFDETPLTKAFDELRATTGAELFVNWKALESRGLKRDTPVTLHVRQKKLSTVISLMLSVSAPADAREFGYSVQEGVVAVSTTDDLDKNVAIRVYDVRDLLAAGKGDRAARVRAVQQFLIAQVDPASWRSAGGRVADLRELQGQLIVTQTPKNHRRIVSLLNGLRELLN